MQSSAAPASSPTSRSFAGMLMDLAAPREKFPPARDTTSLLDGLEDDVATLTYENALRIHGRYRPAGPVQKPHIVPSQLVESAPEVAESVPARANTAPDLRSASVTVRLCRAESDVLRRRAAESGLTLSEYLRSCIFEVETLRAQVKETVAALRAEQSQGESHPRAWWQRLFPRLGASRQIA